jgi:hypothetical protein
MVFVGRERETARIAAELSSGRNVVVAGTCGIGRTSLVRHVAESMGGQWRFLFVDFSQAPARVWLDLAGMIERRRVRTSRLGKITFRSARSQVLTAEPGEAGRRVLVLDNVGTVTAPRLGLVGRLVSAGRFQLIAVADSQIGQAKVLLLRGALYPVALLELARLPRRACREYFETVSRRLGLDWGEGEIAGLAEATGGFPLMMAEAASRAQSRAAVSGGSAPGAMERNSTPHAPVPSASRGSER